MASRKLRCPVCGRVFYEGQGVRLNIAGREIVFHSKTCALKFVRSLLLYIDQKELEKALRMALREFEEKLRELEEMRSKKIV